MEDFALGDQVGDDARDLFDGSVRVDAVLVVQVDVVGAEALKEPSTADLMLAGLLSMTPGLGPLSVWETRPNFVAMTTSSRRPLTACPTTSSLWNGP